MLYFGESKMFSVISDNFVEIVFLIAVVVILYIYKTKGSESGLCRKP